MSFHSGSPPAFPFQDIERKKSGIGKQICFAEIRRRGYWNEVSFKKFH
jgi:hypothetical protein